MDHLPEPRPDQLPGHLINRHSGIDLPPPSGESWNKRLADEHLRLHWNEDGTHRLDHDHVGMPRKGVPLDEPIPTDLIEHLTEQHIPPGAPWDKAEMSPHHLIEEHLSQHRSEQHLLDHHHNDMREDLTERTYERSLLLGLVGPQHIRLYQSSASFHAAIDTLVA